MCLPVKIRRILAKSKQNLLALRPDSHQGIGRGEYEENRRARGHTRPASAEEPFPHRRAAGLIPAGTSPAARRCPCWQWFLLSLVPWARIDSTTRTRLIRGLPAPVGAHLRGMTWSNRRCGGGSRLSKRFF